MVRKEKDFILGIDIGGTKIALALGESTGRVLERFRMETRVERGPHSILEDLKGESRNMLKRMGLGGENLLGIGISAPGFLDTRRGVLFSPPNLPGWSRVPLKKILEEEFEARAILENDANAAALAESFFGAGKGFQDIVYLTMSTGIGGGIIIGGRLHRGCHDAAGEVGHHTLVPHGPRCGCGKQGCMEALCSGSGLTRRLKEVLEEEPGSVLARKAVESGSPGGPPLLFEAAREGDALALEIIEEAGKYLGWGLANIANILDPEIIILGTLVVKSGDLLLAPARRVLKEYLFGPGRPLPLLAPARLGDELQYLAGISIVLYEEGFSSK